MKFHRPDWLPVPPVGYESVESAPILPTGWSCEAWSQERPCIDGMPGMTLHWMLAWHERQRVYATADASSYAAARERLIDLIRTGLTESAATG